MNLSVGPGQKYKQNKMKLSMWIFIGLLGIVQAITVEDLYPFSEEHDKRLPNGDSQSSRKLALSVPAKFYDKEYDYLWINTDGYISFDHQTRDVLSSNFPFNEALLSPFMSDLDTTSQGNVFYRESSDIGVRFRATTDIRRAFPAAAADFDAESVFIVTWHEVEGRSLTGETATFTFQSVLVSNGRDTYAIFLYPENKMGTIPAGQKRKSAMFQAKTGFNKGSDRYLEMYPVDSLADHRNTRSKGEWIFQIGGSGVIDNNDVIAPERVRHTKRQAVVPVINVQDVNLEDDDDDDDFRLPVIPSRRPRDFCSRSQEPCVAENSECVNFERGYCCRCLSGYFGNGKVCLKNDEPMSVNGNVSGVIDVRDASGSVERLQVSNVGLHSYVITNEGRAYTAISGIDSALGLALQPISAIGEIIGWLFASSSPTAPNGFQFTGGSFQRRVNIEYDVGGYRFAMTQRFLGVREDMGSGVNVVVVDTKFVGMLPSIPADAEVLMSDYTDDYVKSSPGRISTNSTRSYTVGNVTHSYRITQDIIFSECRDSMKSIQETLKLHVSRIFLNFHETDDNVRYALNTKMAAPGSGVVSSHPCETRTHGCHPNAECEPLEGQDFACVCRPGYAGDGQLCDDFDECIRRPCPENSICVNEPGSYTCNCVDGYEKNARTQQCEIEDVDECISNSNNCAYDATCTNTVGSYHCACNPGYRGDGYTCEAVECPGNQVYSNCASCFTTCEERSRPKICTSQCRMQCTCPLNTFLNGDMCVTAEECPAPREKSRCEKLYEKAANLLNENPSLQDGPDFPTCLPNGLFARKQCNEFTNVCWCVDQETGSAVIDTTTRRGMGDRLDCEDILSSHDQSPCIMKHAEVEQFHRNNPNIQDGPIYPKCANDGTFTPRQCNGFTQACWCVNVQTGDVIPNTMTRPGEGTRLDCSDILSSHDQSPCILRHAEVEQFHRNNPNIQDGPIYPKCANDGTFTPRQCNGFTQACWCVNVQTGDIIPNTMTLPGEGARLDCSDRVQNPPKLTPCQQQKAEAQEAQSRGGSARGPIFQPICTGSGAFEPIQYNPSGYFMCVDVNGEEVSRHRTQPECLTQCQLQAYYAEADNRLIGTRKFVPRCTGDGSYNTVQCDPVSTTCYCVNQNGEEIQGSRISTNTPETVTEELLECSRLDPSRNQNQRHTAQLVFAQSMGINAINLPVTADSVAQRLYSRIGHVAVGVAFDCSSQNVYWTDVSSKAIFMSSVSDPGTTTRVVGTSMKSPEGVAVDFISGNLYWTDSGTDTIEVAKKDGSNRAILVSSGLKNPRGIAVDPFGGQMYWTDWNRRDPKIMTANLDGSHPTVFLRAGLNLPNDIAIDPFNRRLCFVDAGTKKVECMSLDGSNRRVVHNLQSSSSPGVKKPFGLAVDGGKVYYTDRRGDRLYAVDTTTNDDRSFPGPLGTHGHMYGVAIAYSQCSYGYNGCSRNNGGCSHLCLPIPNGRTCKCPDGDSSCTGQ